MSRNVTILVIILIIILIAGYLVWLRGRFQAAQIQPVPTPTPAIKVAIPTPQPTIASPSATPIATPTGRLSPIITRKPTPAKGESTGAGQVIR